MAWVRFTRDFTWNPIGESWAKGYRADMRVNVPRACADEAINAGKAVAIVPPTRRIAAILADNPFWSEAPRGTKRTR